MTDLREKVATAIAMAAHGMEYPSELYLDEADAAIKAVLDALKEPSEAMVEEGRMLGQQASLAWRLARYGPPCSPHSSATITSRNSLRKMVS